MMPLTMAKISEINTIKKITGKDEVRKHLAELGFVVGARVAVVSKMGGSMIISVQGARMALDKNILNRIMV